MIRDEIGKQVEELIAKNGKASPKDIEQSCKAVIRGHYTEISNAPTLPHLAKYPAKLKRAYASKIDRVRDDVFEKLPIARKSRSELTEVAVCLFCSDWFPFGQSGIVISGFGESEIFPSLVEMSASKILGGTVKYKAMRQTEIRRTKTTAAIVPFAQREMVNAFMEGIDPGYRLAIDGYLETMFTQYPVNLLNALPGISAGKKASLIPKLQDVGKRLLIEFNKQMTAYQRGKHIDPVLGAIGVLSKDMLAEVAESLVSLTSFKRRISVNSAETVGGPIDVAVISRGDGFVWIKRKHYFKPELNPHFTRNYFGDADEN